MKQQRGVALLLVLITLALMASVAALMTQSTSRAYLYTQTLLTRQQARWYFRGAEQLVSRILLQDLEDSPHKTSLAQYWAQRNRLFPLEGATLRGTVADANACFNLNALRQSVASQEQDNHDRQPLPDRIFYQLLLNQGLETSQAERVVNSLRDWLDADSQALSSGAEDEFYAALPLPYRAANQMMFDVSELRLVAGVDARLYQRLLPFICALPVESLMININTLAREQAPLLAAILLNDLDVAQASALLEQRPVWGWDSSSEFIAQLEGVSAESQNVAKSTLVVNSEWFALDAQIAMDDRVFSTQTLFHREAKNVVVTRRSPGIWLYREGSSSP